ncbi:MAG: TolB family protein [Parabacteroides sp.]
MAPLNFRLPGTDWLEVCVELDGTCLGRVRGKGLAAFPEKEWHAWLAQGRGSALRLTVTAWSKQHPEGLRYQPFHVYISMDSIDSYIVYRLIEPGYELWHRMGIYQRDLTSFDEKVIVTNRQNQDGCVNCHAFCQYDPSLFMFHARGVQGTTVLVQEGEPSRLDLAQLPPYRAGTYPYWHPSGRYLLFSANDTHQSFYHFGQMPVEVYDLASDLMIYDRQEKRVLQDPRFSTEEQLETFPCFSPAGDRLYFCVAPFRKMPMENRTLRYALCAVDFDAATGQLGEVVDTLYAPDRQGGSASFPRISPDGRFLLYTESECATFPIWHKEADLQMIRLADGRKMDTTPLHSDESESYHCWSSNGRWVVFSSRRLDGRYTRLYLAAVDSVGHFGKPFLLPQSDPDENNWRLKSYNIPEFVRGAVRLNGRKVRSLFDQPSEKL